MLQPYTRLHFDSQYINAAEAEDIVLCNVAAVYHKSSLMSHVSLLACDLMSCDSVMKLMPQCVISRLDPCVDLCVCLCRLTCLRSIVICG